VGAGRVAGAGCRVPGGGLGDGRSSERQRAQGQAAARRPVQTQAADSLGTEFTLSRRGVPAGRPPPQVIVSLRSA
jgi:hypothetical protein